MEGKKGIQQYYFCDRFYFYSSLSSSDDSSLLLLSSLALLFFASTFPSSSCSFALGSSSVARFDLLTGGDGARLLTALGVSFLLLSAGGDGARLLTALGVSFLLLSAGGDGARLRLLTALGVSFDIRADAKMLLLIYVIKILKKNSLCCPLSTILTISMRLCLP
jgi:hypothetical protein